MDERNCASCLFWRVPRVSDNDLYVGQRDRRTRTHSECRLNPPVPMPGEFAGRFPLTHMQTWCAKWEPNW
jgi:hypothetical protein